MPHFNLLSVKKGLILALQGNSIRFPDKILKDGKEFIYKQIFTPDSTQKEVYDSLT